MKLPVYLLPNMSPVESCKSEQHKFMIKKRKEKNRFDPRINVQSIANMLNKYTFNMHFFFLSKN